MIDTKQALAAPMALNDLQSASAFRLDYCYMRDGFLEWYLAPGMQVSIYPADHPDVVSGAIKASTRVAIAPAAAVTQIRQGLTVQRALIKQALETPAT